MQLSKIFQFAKLGVLGLSLSLGAIVLSGCGGGGGGTGAPKPDPNAIRVACVGDSITHGDELDDREYNSYPSVLARRLGRTYFVGNFGEGGAAVFKNAGKSYYKLGAYKRALAFKPKIFVIMLDPSTKPSNPFLFVITKV
jgi:hypothetical protein